MLWSHCNPQHCLQWHLQGSGKVGRVCESHSFWQHVVGSLHACSYVESRSAVLTCSTICYGVVLSRSTWIQCLLHGSSVLRWQESESYVTNHAGYDWGCTAMKHTLHHFPQNTEVSYKIYWGHRSLGTGKFTVKLNAHNHGCYQGISKGALPL